MKAEIVIAGLGILIALGILTPGFTGITLAIILAVGCLRGWPYIMRD